MSPEQAKGKVVDKRADVWAFGAVLYEMLTGQKPFVGEDVSDTLATVLKTDPEWNALPAETPQDHAVVVRLLAAMLHNCHDVLEPVTATFADRVERRGTLGWFPGD